MLERSDSKSKNTNERFPEKDVKFLRGRCQDLARPPNAHTEDKNICYSVKIFLLLGILLLSPLGPLPFK